MIANHRAVILSEGRTATTDYYLIPHLESLGYETFILDTRTVSDNFNFTNVKLLVISRYLSSQQLKLLEKLAQNRIKIVYFMDDDLFDLQALRGLPWLYQWKIITKALKHRSRLEKRCDEFWVSTLYLADKYSELRPIVLSPVRLPDSAENKPMISVCYHGTASHKDEIKWLLPIISEVQSRSDHVHFELFGSRAIVKEVARIPRVSVLHPLSWPNYLAFTLVQKKDIALAPLLKNSFNAARGPTKFYDYARMDAIGLYSNVAPYQDFIDDGNDGFLLENKPDFWADKILQIANDSLLRQRLLSNIKQRLSLLPTDSSSL